MNIKRLFFLFTLSACAGLGAAETPREVLRVGSYNIRLSGADHGTDNAWQVRKADLVKQVKQLKLDVFGMQEVCPDQAQYLREELTGYVFVGEHRGRDRKSDEASPVFYRESRFEKLNEGTFWLSETPETPGSKSWESACPRVCTYVTLKDKTTGVIFCFANTHTDHRSAKARECGMRLILERMRNVAHNLPVVFTGDHNCDCSTAPARLARQVFNDAREVVEKPAQGPHSTFHGFGQNRNGPRIDYIYVTPGVRVLDFVTHDDKRPGTELYPSDHYPITATLVINASPADSSRRPPRVGQ